SCDDDTLNQTETDVDCGSMCPACAPTQHCRGNSDCDSGVCSGSPLRCRAATCSDDTLNGGETDVDCGGSTSCSRCEAGGVCAGHGDCTSGRCVNFICQTPTCTDV